MVRDSGTKVGFVTGPARHAGRTSHGGTEPDLTQREYTSPTVGGNGSGGAMAQPVICGVDESTTSRAAARRAAEIAAALSAPLHLVTALPVVLPLAVEGVAPLVWADEAVAPARERLRALAGELGTDEDLVHVRVADPAPAVCELAKQVSAQLIVVGNRRVQGMARLLGSVAVDILRHASCDVVVVNTTGTAELPRS